jgi:hypothetical protein
MLLQVDGVVQTFLSSLGTLSKIRTCLSSRKKNKQEIKIQYRKRVYCEKRKAFVRSDRCPEARCAGEKA